MADAARAVLRAAGNAGNATGDKTESVFPTGNTTGLGCILCPEEIGCSPAAGATTAGASSATTVAAAGIGAGVGIDIAAIGAAGAAAGVTSTVAFGSTGGFALGSTPDNATGNSGTSAREETGRAVAFDDVTSSVVATTTGWPTGKVGWAGATVLGVGATATVTTGGADGADCTATGIVGPRPTEGFASGNAGAIISAIGATTTVATGRANGVG